MSIKRKKPEDPTPHLTKLEDYAKDNTRTYPKLNSAIKELRQFVGAIPVKETVAKSVQYVISHQMAVRPMRKSTRKRKEPQHLVLGKTTSRRAKRPRLDTEDSDIWEDAEDDDDDEDDDMDDDDVDEAMRNLGGIIAAALRQHGMKEDESSDDEDEDEERILRYKKPEYLKGLFQHTMLLGAPGTGKTTFAHILVSLWDSLGIVDKKRFFVTSRGDWVGKYQGHSVDKAKKLISKARGGVIFIDEAYSLIAAKDGDDTYGHEVLTEIVETMSNNDKNVTFIFAGYAEDMNRLFGANKGLSRRFGYIFKLSKPDVLHLFLIFQKQLLETKWKVPKGERQAVVAFFQQHNKIFEWGGGSTTTFIQHAKQAAIARSFPKPHDRKILLSDLKEAKETLMQHNQTTDAMPPGIRNMYL
jgi:SpoVK/Ycf46/Vps4 family AAA+-type ATPase